MISTYIHTCLHVPDFYGILRSLYVLQVYTDIICVYFTCNNWKETVGRYRMPLPCGEVRFPGTIFANKNPRFTKTFG